MHNSCARIQKHIIGNLTGMVDGNTHEITQMFGQSHAKIQEFTYLEIINSPLAAICIRRTAYKIQGFWKCIAKHTRKYIENNIRKRTKIYEKVHDAYKVV